jgi:hypothetical protein
LSEGQACTSYLGRVVGGWLREILAIFLLVNFRRIRNFVEHRDLKKFSEPSWKKNLGKIWFLKKKFAKQKDFSLYPLFSDF